MRIDTQAQARAALRLAIKQSGMSQIKYARNVLIRGERTVRRWLNDPTSDIPEAVIHHLERTVKEEEREFPCWVCGEKIDHSEGRMVTLEALCASCERERRGL